MKKVSYIIGIFLGVLLQMSCSSTKFVPDGEYLLDNVNVVSDNELIKGSDYRSYVRQNPNARWFSSLRVPLHIYSLAGKDSTKAINKLLHKMGEKPVLFDESLQEKSIAEIRQGVMNQGFLSAQVTVNNEIKKKKLKQTFYIHPGERYYVSKIDWEVSDPVVDSIMNAHRSETLLHEGMTFNINTLGAERSRVNNLLLDRGFYHFNKDYISFEADTTANTRKVELILKVRNPLNRNKHDRFKIESVNVVVGNNPTDSTQFEGVNLFYQDKLPFRKHVLADNVRMRSGQDFCQSMIQDTYDRYNRLGALKYTNIRFTQSPTDTLGLNCMVLTDIGRSQSISAELEGTNSAGDLGAAASLTYSHKNFFHGSELFQFKIRGAYEAITGLEGYSNHDYLEWGAEASFSFPRFLFPFLSHDFREQVKASSELVYQYNMQNRPEFRRRVATMAWRYRWVQPNRKMTHRFDVIDMSYVYMPWISATFKHEYLDNLDKYNAILKYNYEDLFIMKMGYSFVYNSQGLMGITGSNVGTNSYTIRANFETAGNLLYGISNVFGAKQNKDGHYTLVNIAYAQYVKGDFDISKSIRFDSKNSLALHFGLGIAYPYGNSTILPFEKRYFSGGANSVRGWSVRTLGPGSYGGAKKDIDYINQSGDIKLDLNVEYRTHLFWKVNGALFVDAGNIWTIRKYDEQPGGQFKFDKFYKQLAVSYGLGLRLVFDYFTLRFDGGFKAISPVYSNNREHYPFLHPNFKDNFAFHFAVGLPF